MVHREVGRAKDLSAPLYFMVLHAVCLTDLILLYETCPSIPHPQIHYAHL